MENEQRLIDVNAEIRKMREALAKKKCNRRHLTYLVFDAVISVLEKAPTVDAVEVVYGKWENVQNGKGCCSNCHRLDGIDPLATHCRYCGAKMDGGNEDA